MPPQLDRLSLQFARLVDAQNDLHAHSDEVLARISSDLPPMSDEECQQLLSQAADMQFDDTLLDELQSQADSLHLDTTLPQMSDKEFADLQAQSEAFAAVYSSPQPLPAVQKKRRMLALGVPKKRMPARKRK